MQRRFNVMVKARDGVALATDLYLPSSPGPYPAVLSRTPYLKSQPAIQKIVEGWNAQGYALVVQDCRGRGDSDGRFVPYRNEGPDGHDAIEWIASQDWCDGRVATIGGSYGGRIQWFTALQHPPHLRAMIVLVAPSDPFVEAPTIGNFLMQICWLRIVDGRVTQNLDTTDWMSVYGHLPLESMDEAAGFHSEHWREDLRHTSLDPYWEPLCYQTRFEEIDLPVLHVSGWYDDEQIGTPLNFARLAESAATEEARRGQRLLMGPWGHAVNTVSKLGEVDFGPASLIDLVGYQARWLDGVLGRPQPDSADHPVRMFVMGTNVWRDEMEWPLARTNWTSYHLHSGGSAGSRFGDGRLSLETSGGDEAPDVYLYDPARPVPFLTEAESNQVGGPDDYSAVEHRADVLCYTTEILSEDVEVTGPVHLELYASSSAADTDFTGKLLDVHPNGFCQRLCDGIVRASHRAGADRNDALTPDVVYKFEIDLWNTSQVFKVGHRIRLEVSSSAFPKFDRNLNTGEPVASATRMVVAENRVWHTSEHPSRLILPVIPRGEPSTVRPATVG